MDSRMSPNGRPDGCPEGSGGLDRAAGGEAFPNVPDLWECLPWNVQDLRERPRGTCRIYGRIRAAGRSVAGAG